MRSEYERLFNLYNIETQVTSALKEELLTEINLKNELNSKLADALEGLDMKDGKESEAKKLKSEKRLFEEKFENKCLEIKQERKEILSVASKGSKQEVKDLGKAFAKEKSSLESKVHELSVFKAKKQEEERVEKLRKRKEIKKSKQKNLEAFSS